MTLEEFLHMGGYAGFVWPAYGLWAAVVALNIWSARRSLRDARLRATRRLAAQASAAPAGRS